jgi:hypothetical protein
VTMSIYWDLILCGHWKSEMSHQRGSTLLRYKSLEILNLWWYDQTQLRNVHNRKSFSIWMHFLTHPSREFVILHIQNITVIHVSVSCSTGISMKQIPTSVYFAVIYQHFSTTYLFLLRKKYKRLTSIEFGTVHSNRTVISLAIQTL